MDAEVSSALDAVLDEQRVVTFRYLAQHHGMPVEKAKKALQAYAKAHAGSVHALYMVGGARGGDAGGLEFKLVPEAEVEGAAADYEGSLLARHVYSLHAAAPEGASAGEALWSLNHGQDRELYAQLGREANCLIDNRWGAIKCRAAVVRKGGPPAAPPIPAAAEPARSLSAPKAKAPAPAPADGPASTDAASPPPAAPSGGKPQKRVLSFGRKPKKAAEPAVDMESEAAL